MARDRHDTRTPDLLSYQAGSSPVAVRFEEPPRGATLGARVALSLSQVMAESPFSREEIAQRMTAFLGESVSVHILNAYTSQARKSHAISLQRAIAFCHASQDFRLLGTLIEDLGYAVIPKRFVAAAEEAMVAEKIEDLQRDKAQLRQKWRGR